MTNALERLVEQLRRLPGIGSKSARRLAYHLVEMPKGKCLVAFVVLRRDGNTAL